MANEKRAILNCCFYSECDPAKRLFPVQSSHSWVIMTQELA
jgi:hypothetical protein